MELDVIKNQKQLKPRGTKCELRLSVDELGEDGEPTKECLSLLLAVAHEKICKFNQDSLEYFILHSISKVEWITKYAPTIQFIYYTAQEEIMDEG